MSAMVKAPESTPVNLSELWNQVAHSEVGEKIGLGAIDDALDRFIPEQARPKFNLENYRVQHQVACAMRVMQFKPPPKARVNCDCMRAVEIPALAEILERRETVE